jgi:7-cyano-7-deazaguanine synthase
LSIATAYALKYKCSRVWFGAHKDDAHNWAYPDCTPEFIGAMYTAIDIGTYHQVSLITPFSVNTKAEIVEQGFNLKVPMELTYSCYVGEKLHCGTCPTCVSRIEAFKQSGVEDKTEYANSIIA